MSLLTLVLPLALLLAAFWVLAFSWSARSGQLDDMDSPAVRMLHDDEPANLPEQSESTASGSSGDAAPPGGEEAS